MRIFCVSIPLTDAKEPAQEGRTKQNHPDPCGPGLANNHTKKASRPNLSEPGG
jgi:hypothetical protein